MNNNKKKIFYLFLVAFFSMPSYIGKNINTNTINSAKLIQKKSLIHKKKIPNKKKITKKNNLYRVQPVMPRPPQEIKFIEDAVDDSPKLIGENLLSKQFNMNSNKSSKNVNIANEESENKKYCFQSDDSLQAEALSAIENFDNTLEVYKKELVKTQNKNKIKKKITTNKQIIQKEEEKNDFKNEYLSSFAEEYNDSNNNYDNVNFKQEMKLNAKISQNNTNKINENRNDNNNNKKNSFPVSSGNYLESKKNDNLQNDNKDQGNDVNINTTKISDNQRKSISYIDIKKTNIIIQDLKLTLEEINVLGKFAYKDKKFKPKINSKLKGNIKLQNFQLNGLLSCGNHKVNKINLHLITFFVRRIQYLKKKENVVFAFFIPIYGNKLDNSSIEKKFVNKDLHKMGPIMYHVSYGMELLRSMNKDKKANSTLGLLFHLNNENQTDFRCISYRQTLNSKSLPLSGFCLQFGVETIEEKGLEDFIIIKDENDPKALAIFESRRKKMNKYSSLRNLYGLNMYNNIIRSLGESSRKVDIYKLGVLLKSVEFLSKNQLKTIVNNNSDILPQISTNQIKSLSVKSELSLVLLYFTEKMDKKDIQAFGFYLKLKLPVTVEYFNNKKIDVELDLVMGNSFENDKKDDQSKSKLFVPVLNKSSNYTYKIEKKIDVKLGFKTTLTLKRFKIIVETKINCTPKSYNLKSFDDINNYIDNASVKVETVKLTNKKKWMLSRAGENKNKDYKNIFVEW